MLRTYCSPSHQELADIVEKGDAVIIDTNAFQPFLIKESITLKDGQRAVTYSQDDGILSVAKEFLFRNEFYKEFKKVSFKHLDSLLHIFKNYNVIAPFQLAAEVENYQNCLIKSIRYFKVVLKNYRAKKNKGEDVLENTVFQKLFPFLKAYRKRISAIASRFTNYDSVDRNILSFVNSISEEAIKKIKYVQPEKELSETDKMIVAAAISYSTSNGAKAVIISRDNDIRYLFEEVKRYKNGIGAVLLYEYFSKGEVKTKKISI